MGPPFGAALFFAVEREAGSLDVAARIGRCERRTGELPDLVEEGIRRDGALAHIRRQLLQLAEQPHDIFVRGVQP